MVDDLVSDDVARELRPTVVVDTSLGYLAVAVARIRAARPGCRTATGATTRVGAGTGVAKVMALAESPRSRSLKFLRWGRVGWGRLVTQRDRLS